MHSVIFAVCHIEILKHYQTHIGLSGYTFATVVHLKFQFYTTSNSFIHTCFFISYRNTQKYIFDFGCLICIAISHLAVTSLLNNDNFSHHHRHCLYLTFTVLYEDMENVRQNKYPDVPTNKFTKTVQSAFTWNKMPCKKNTEPVLFGCVQLSPSGLACIIMATP